MKQYKILFSNHAERDALESFCYLYFELENPQFAQKFRDSLKDKVRLLSSAPFMGEIYEALPEYRVIHMLKYRIFYAVDERNQTIIISRVFYTGRDNPGAGDLPASS